MSLRARLIVGMLLLMALAIGAVSAITYLALRTFLVDRIDGQLRSLPPGLASGCERFPDQSPPPPIPILVARLNADGTPARPCPDNGFQRPLQLSAADGARLAGRPRTAMLVSGPDGPARAMALPGRTGGVGRGRAVAGRGARDPGPGCWCRSWWSARSRCSAPVRRAHGGWGGGCGR